MIRVAAVVERDCPVPEAQGCHIHVERQWPEGLGPRGGPETGNARNRIFPAAAENRNLLSVPQGRRRELDNFLAGDIPQEDAECPHAAERPSRKPHDREESRGWRDGLVGQSDQKGIGHKYLTERPGNQPNTQEGCYEKLGSRGDGDAQVRPLIFDNRPALAWRNNRHICNPLSPMDRTKPDQC